MSQETRPEVIARKRVVYELPNMDAVTVRRDVDCAAPGEAPLLMDVHYPPGRSPDSRPPVVVIVAGYPDRGTRAMLGCSFKEMGSTVSWAQLAAASGIAAIAYANRDPAPDVHAVLGYVRANAETLGLDAGRIGIWASSGNGPLAMSMLMTGAADYLVCAVLSCPLTLDLDGSTAIADAQRMWRFANPAAGRTIHDLRADVPMLIARGGADQTPRLNETADAFIAKALARNLPLTVVNHPTGPHSFDLFDDSDACRAVVKQILWFLQVRLGV